MHKISIPSFKIRIGDFGKVLIKFASSQVVSNFLRLLSGFLIISLLDPETYGQYSGVAVFLGYILLGHGGIINGLSRELPYELGKGNDEYAREMASSVFVLTILISVFAALVFLFIAFYHLIFGNHLVGFIYLSYVIISALHILDKQYLPVLYRTNNDFNSLSKQNIRVGLVNLVSVILVYFWGIYGLIFRGLILSIFQCFLLFKNKPYTLTLKYNFEHFKKLFKTGFPIFLVGHVNPLWSTIMNNIILSIGGAFNFGLYSLSTIVQGAIGVIPTTFSSMIYPRMAIMYGQGKTLNDIIKTNVKPLIFQFLLLLSMAVTAALLLPIIIPLILPNYVEGVSAAQWMLFVPVVQSFNAINNIYNVIKKQTYYFISLVIGAAIGTSFVYINYQQQGFYLELFPQGLIVGNILQQILSFIFIRKLF